MILLELVSLSKSVSFFRNSLIWNSIRKRNKFIEFEFEK